MVCDVPILSWSSLTQYLRDLPDTLINLVGIHVISLLSKLCYRRNGQYQNYYKSLYYIQLFTIFINPCIIPICLPSQTMNHEYFVSTKSL